MKTKGKLTSHRKTKSGFFKCFVKLLKIAVQEECSSQQYTEGKAHSTNNTTFRKVIRLT